MPKNHELDGLNPGRRKLLRQIGAALIASAVPLVPTVAASGTTLRVALSWIPNHEYSDLWAALDLGFYDEHGLQVDWRPGGPNTPNPVERVVSGEVDIGFQVTLRPLLEAIAKGNDLVIIGARFQKRSGGILSLKRRPVKTIDALVGKKVICPSAVDARTVETALRVAGLPPEFTYVPGGFDPHGLLRGQGDAMVSFSTAQPVLLEMRGLVAEQDFYHRSWSDLGLPGYNTILFTKRSFLSQNRDAIVHFVNGLMRGWRVARQNRAYVIELAVDRYGLEYGLNFDQELRALDVAQKFIETPETRANGLFWMNKERLAGPIYDSLRVGGVESLPDVHTILDMSIVADASRQ